MVCSFEASAAVYPLFRGREIINGHSNVDSKGQTGPGTRNDIGREAIDAIMMGRA